MSLAINYVVNLLSRREYSEYELRTKMQEKQFSLEEIDETLQIAQSRKWQSDVRFCESYLNARAKRGYGINRIKQELQYHKGIDSVTVDQVLAASEIDWFAIALVTLRKNFPNFSEKQDSKSKQKIWRYMLSHGFNQSDFEDYVGSCDVIEEFS